MPTTPVIAVPPDALAMCQMTIALNETASALWRQASALGMRVREAERAGIEVNSNVIELLERLDTLAEDCATQTRTGNQFARIP